MGHISTGYIKFQPIFFEILCGETDRRTHRQTDRQTDRRTPPKTILPTRGIAGAQIKKTKKKEKKKSKNIQLNVLTLCVGYWWSTRQLEEQSLPTLCVQSSCCATCRRLTSSFWPVKSSSASSSSTTSSRRFWRYSQHVFY